MKNLVILFCLFLTGLLYSQKELPLYSIAPEVIGKDQYGKQINLKDMLNEGSVVVVFYRGEWCPHCNRYMSFFADSVDQINELGAKVIAITPEKTENIKETINKTGAGFSIIYDKDHKIMDDYHVTFRLNWSLNLLYNTVGININKASGNEDRVLPVPATYIINREGIIIGSHFNEDYTIRMSVKEILKVLEENKKVVVKATDLLK